MDFYHRLLEAAGSDHVLRDEPMAVHTTFRIGGPADYFVEPADASALAKGIALCREVDVDYFVTGELLVEAGAGVMLSRLARQVSSMGYTGFEYATGIPGTLGGGVTMNAGAYGGEISDNILWAELMDETGAILKLEKEHLKLSYRHSVMMEHPLVVLRAGFSFKKGDAAAISDRVTELSRLRREKQPLEYPSAGSTFKRPEGYFAGKLIQDCGLKGFRVGDAVVSEKHSGFVINAGQATAADVMALIRHVQQEVEEKFHVRIEPEVRLLGEF